MEFFKMIENNTSLPQIFTTQNAFEQKVSCFEKTMNSIFHQTFPKICDRKRKFKEDDIGFLISILT